ncbi:MAG: AI-2E family transporter [Anaerolineales bacterium]|nr:AI-2E family transporter [Anaerolineales bacterium]
MSIKLKNSPAQINIDRLLTIDKQTVFYFLIVIGIYWVTSLYRAVISSLVLGILLAYLLHPLVVFLTNKAHLYSRLSVGIVFFSFITLIIALTRLATPILINQIRLLTNDFQVISNELIELQPALDEFAGIDIPLADIIPEIENEINQFLVPARLFRMLRSATDNLVWIMITFMTCFYLLLDQSKLINWIYQITPQSMRNNLRQILVEINLVWKTYLRGQFSMMLIIGFLSGLGGVAVGLKNALIIGVIAGILELIPSLGPTIATFIAGMSAWTQGSLTLNISNFWFAVVVCSIFIIIQILENTVLIPRVMSKQMNIHPALVFIAIVSTLLLFGVLAGLIVIPVIGSLVVIIKYAFQHLDQIPAGSLSELP